jgi:selenocysteine lyase/cysteine desulfurase
MINESLKLITLWNPKNIQTYLTYLTDYFINKLENLILNNYCKDIFIILSKTNRCGHIIGLKIKDNNIYNINAINIGNILLENNIYVSIRSGSIRISPYIFNTINDMEKLLKILCEEL